VPALALALALILVKDPRDQDANPNITKKIDGARICEIFSINKNNNI